MTPPADLNKFYPAGPTGVVSQDQLLHIVAGLLQQLTMIAGRVYEELENSARKNNPVEITFDVRQLKERVDELYRAVVSGNFGKPGLVTLANEHDVNIEGLQDADMNLEKTLSDVQSRVMELERAIEKDAGKNSAWAQTAVLVLSILSIVVAGYAAFKS